MFNRIWLGGVGCLLLLGLGGPVAAKVIYVKADAAGANNGQSWAGAFTDLQLALAAAEWGDEIWVAAGTYKPTSGTDRTKSFVMPAGVEMYGGFAGGEVGRNRRDWRANETILSGEIGSAATTSDNSKHVVSGGHQAVLDGFSITAGNTLDGAGMINDGLSPETSNCRFYDNTANRGGAVFNTNGSRAIFIDCQFDGNIGGSAGGGMYNYRSSPVIERCVFDRNATGAFSTGAEGGAIFNEESSPIVTACIFTRNTSRNMGGGISSAGSASAPVFTNCVMEGNTAAVSGGAIYSRESRGMFINCTITQNSSSEYGGGIYERLGTSLFLNCILQDNESTVGAESFTYAGSPRFQSCLIDGCGGSGPSWNTALGTDGGGNIMANPAFADGANPVGADGTWLTADDGLRLLPGSPCIDAGRAAGAPLEDILGVPRLGVPDIGAYEFRDSRSGTMTWGWYH